MDWQPIETAPKDGTAILTVVAGFEPSVSQWVDRKVKARWCIDPETFMEQAHFEEYFWNTRYEPTHWMPLPAPPKES